MKRVVCVLGMHRSGTSAITRGINLLGAYIGEDYQLLPPNDENMEGFWEHSEIVKVHDEILQVLSSSWNTRLSLPDGWQKDEKIQPLKRALINIVKQDFYKHDLWVWKDPRTCLLLPIWIDILEELNIEPSFVLVIRNPLNVAKSLEKRNGMILEEGLANWALHTLNSLIFTKDYRRTIVHYDEYVEDWYTNLRHISKMIDLPWPEDEKFIIKTMNDFIRPELRHNKINNISLNKNQAPEFINEIYEYCLKCLKDEEFFQANQDEERIRTILTYYNQFSNVFRITPPVRFDLQCFWNEENSFQENKSIIKIGYADGLYHEYKLNLPNLFPIRLDLTNIPSIIYIKSIDIYSRNKINNIFLVDSCNNANDFEGLVELENVSRVMDFEDYTIISKTKDPQLLFKGNPNLESYPELTFKIIMKVIPIAEEIADTISCVSQKWFDIKDKFEKYDEQMSILSNSINYLTNENNHKANEIVENNHQINQLETEVSVLVNKNVSLENEYQVLSNKICDYMQSFEDLNQKLVELENQLSMTSDYNFELIKTIGEKDLIIENSKEHLLFFEEQSEKLKENIIIKQQEIKRAAGDIEHRDNVINNLNDEIKFLESQIQLIKDSQGYKFLKKYYRLRDNILPEHSKRRTLFKLGYNIVVNRGALGRIFTKSNIKKGLYYLKKGNISSIIARIELFLKQNEVNIHVIQSSNNYIEKVLQNENSKIFDLSHDITVDVIVPIYDAYDYTKKCLETVYENSDMNYNLYLINDCSPDQRISELLEEYARKEKPNYMKNLFVINNESNLGFVKNVNKGMSLSQNHVVLLNTDTEVPPGWISRLMQPILTDERIASVTPFSNSATTCSFPRFCEDNDLPNHLTVEQVDSMFRIYGSSETIQLPSGVGFCMAINRHVLNKVGAFDDEAFGKGYGEENDWCMRAYHAGYQNVLVQNLFVYHKHGVSFRQHKDKAREDRIAENLRKVEERYPDYVPWVHRFIGEDPIKQVRQLLTSIVFSSKSGKEGVLYINHTLGGGTQLYEEKLIEKNKDQKRNYTFHLFSDEIQIEDYTQGFKYRFNKSMLTQESFKGILSMFNIDVIYINQLVTFPNFLMQFIQNSGLKYTYFVHDYFAVCPSYNLINDKEIYCHGVTDISICQKCIQNNLVTEPWINMRAKDIDIQKWRESFYEFLGKASHIIAPSLSTKEIVQKYYPNLDIQVIEHEIVTPVKNTFKHTFADSINLNVAFIGAIGESKGSHIIYELKDMIERRDLPINLKVIGVTNINQNPYKSEDGRFEIYGRYDNVNISNILEKLEISVVIIPALWPETYSYTTSEAMFSGYPVITFNIGAPAERVQRYDGGWLVDEMNSFGIYSVLIKLLRDRQDIVRKANNLKDLIKFQ
ncbi:glycosyltransferase [Paenibacillus sp. y28]|uniref:glycosyltransferase n=1 Tax=Paenibacillus sp. y28 TaxID=3129110 RepID=UPI00301774FF